MDILDVDLAGDDGHAGGEHDALLPLSAVSTDATPCLPGAHAGDDAALAASASDANRTRLHRRSTTSSSDLRPRRRVSKRLQLLLVRQYIYCARQLQRLPDRLETEQVIQRGHDEFVLQGGSSSEPKLTYSAFLKLVRNRRGEFARLRHGKKLSEQQQDMRELIAELDQLKSQHQGFGRDDGLLTSHNNDHHQFEAVNSSMNDHVELLDEATDALVGETDHSAVDGELSTAESYTSAMASHSSAGSGGTIIVPRAKLDMMLRAAQETLREQRKILEEVRAIENRLSGIRWPEN